MLSLLFSFTPLLTLSSFIQFDFYVNKVHDLTSVMEKFSRNNREMNKNKTKKTELNAWYTQKR